tara:strand:+ start:6462 stop:6839 length:378 start_codon:yes stop_codon:yes gene_type:complete
MTTNDINELKYVFTYKKKDGTIRDIKTNKNINTSKPNYITVWDCEKNDYRTLIKDKIQKTRKYDTVFTYKKLDNSIRKIKGNIIKKKDKNIIVWDSEKNNYRNLIEDRIKQYTLTISFFLSSEDI